MCTILLPPSGKPIAVNKYIITVVSPKRNRTFEIARQWARAGRLWRWCCVAGTLSFIFSLATSRHFNWSSSYAGLSERVFSALGDFLQVEKWRNMNSNIFAWKSVSNWEKPVRRLVYQKRSVWRSDVDMRVSICVLNMYIYIKWQHKASRQKITNLRPLTKILMRSSQHVTDGLGLLVCNAVWVSVFRRLIGT
jgi:hypothetical protein